MKALNILGTRGVPGRHGGYETFASKLAPYLVSQGWQVSVYCQLDDPTPAYEDSWNGVRRVHFPAGLRGAAGTMQFDAKCVRHVLGQPGIDLVLGYNTALFNTVQRMRGRTVAMNMDGIEWKRDKWSLPAKAWFFLNELAGSAVCNMLIADHPEMEKHARARSRRPIAMIPYGGDVITSAPIDPLPSLGLEPDRYLIVVARPMPENSILEIIRAFSLVKRGMKLAVLGDFKTQEAYQRACIEAASDEVVFTGPIFEADRLQSLRFHARGYVHGHRVGGTNPSLCEALGAGNAVIAHDNRFNRWTAGEGQFFFADEAECAAAMDMLIGGGTIVERARSAARLRHQQDFRWEHVLQQYEALLEGLL